MIAAKFGDVVLGIDMHQVMVPTPAGPVPAPLPHPFIGVVYDPIGAAIGAAMGAVFGGGGAVLINGMPAANTGTDIIGTGHIPTPPGVAPSPADKPGNDGTLVFGSQTVKFGGSSQSRLGSVATTCNFPVNLPTSACAAAPMGALVLIGGPPAADYAAAATQGIRTKWVSDKLHKLAKATKGGKRSKAICFSTGHPVDVMTGELLAESVDFELPGLIPLKWERNYRSRETYEGALGPGWYHPFEEFVARERHGLRLFLGDGRWKELPLLDAVGAEHFDAEDRFTLTRTEHGYERWSLADGRRYLYEEQKGKRTHLLSVVRDRSGNTIRLEYERGYLIRIIDTAERTLDVTWAGNGRIAQIAYKSHIFVRYEYEELGRLIAAYDTLEQAERYEYAPCQGAVMLKETHRGGLSFHFEWDWQHPEGWCTRTWGEPGGSQGVIYVRVITYDKHRHFTLVEDGRGGKTHYWGNGMGLVDKETDPMGTVTEYEWDEHCRKLSETDGAGNTRRWTYDAWGNCIEEADPIGNATRCEFDAQHRIVRVDEPAGSWTVGYHYETQQPEWVRDPLNHTTSYHYDNRGHLSAIQDPAGRTQRYSWTDHHLLEAATDGEGRTERYAYDELGRLVWIRDAAGRESQAERDALGRITRLTRGDGEVVTMRYDAEGDVIEQTNSHGHRVRMRYNGMGQLIEHIDAMGHIVKLEYDTEEDLTAITNQLGERYRFKLDRAGRVETEIGFDHRRHRYIYDAVGNVSRVLGPDNRVTFLEYDAAGRLTKSTTGAEEEGFAYDAQGNLVWADSSDVSVRFDRDALGRLVCEQQGLGDVPHSIDSRYDGSGLRTERDTSMGQKVRYQWDKGGELASLQIGAASWLDQPALRRLGMPVLERSDWRMTIERNAAGEEVARHLPGAIVATWQRDRFGRPAERRVIRQARPATSSRPALPAQDVLRVGYMWSSAEQLGALTDMLANSVTRYEHDPRGHLVRAVLANGQVQHRSADLAGNVIPTENPTEVRYGHGGRLLRLRSNEYRYNAHGELIEKRLADGASWHYRWSAAGRLIEVERPDGVLVTFTYDVLGRRMSKTFRGATTEYVWDGDELVHERLRDAAGELHPVTSWVFEPGTHAPVAKTTASKRFGIVCDHLGTPQMMADEAGRIVWKAQLDVYGVPQEEVAEEPQPWRYPGQYADDETGLFYNRHRYYDPELGRYISQDPIGLIGGLALYGYVHDPLGGFDPLGLAKGPPVQQGEGGRFSDLHNRRMPFDDLTPHHMPQDALGHLPRDEGGAVVMTHADHKLTRTYGSKGRRTKLADAALGFRDVLANDIRDLRTLFGAKYNDGIRDMMKYYRAEHPDLLSRKPKCG